MSSKVIGFLSGEAANIAVIVKKSDKTNATSRVVFLGGVNFIVKIEESNLYH